MRALRTVLATGLLLLVGCSASAVTIDVVQPPISGLAAASESALSDGTEQAEPAASVGQVDQNPDISESAWCSDLGLQIHNAEKATLEAQLLDVGNLAESVEELHRLYREAASARPVAVAEQIDAVNASLDALEPVLQPVDWDFTAIDRTPIDAAIGAYGDSGMAIDEYNSMTCGLERAGVLPAEDRTIDLDVPRSAPGPTPNPLAAPTQLEIDLFVDQVAGATRAEAGCFLEYRFGVQEGVDPSAALDRLTACGVSVDRVAELDLISLIVTLSPNGPRTDNMIAAMVEQSERTGMTNAEAVCFVDSYVGVVEDRLATDASLEQLLGCGLTVERMDELGLPAGCPWRPGMCAADN